MQDYQLMKGRLSEPSKCIKVVTLAKVEYASNKVQVFSIFFLLKYTKVKGPLRGKLLTF